MAGEIAALRDFSPAYVRFAPERGKTRYVRFVPKPDMTGFSQAWSAINQQQRQQPLPDDYRSTHESGTTISQRLWWTACASERRSMARKSK